MASIKCSKCGSAIRHHGEPCGIEFAMIPKGVWEQMQSAKFVANDKKYDECGQYPKLYRTDTIENDFPDLIVKCWKCPKCNTIHLFEKDGKVKQLFIPGENVEIEKTEFFSEGVIFDDYQWDKLTEMAVPLEKLKEIIIEPMRYLFEKNFLVISAREKEEYFQEKAIDE